MAYLLFGNWLDEIQRAAWPQAIDKSISWTPAAPRAGRPDVNAR